MQITNVNSSGNIGMTLSVEEARILISLVSASSQSGGTTIPRKFVKMFKNAFSHIGIGSNFSGQGAPEDTWTLMSHARIRDVEGNNIS